MNEELKIIISGEIDRLLDALQEGREKIENYRDDTEKAMKAVDAAMDKTKDVAKKAMVGFAAAVAAGVAAIAGLVESTREYRNVQAKLETAFESAGSNAEVAYSVYEKLNGVLGDSDVAVEAANHLAKLTTNEEDLATWTDICTGVYATFGDSLPIEGLTEAANETAKTGQLTGVLADALNWAGVSEDDFQKSLDECTTEQERNAKITKTLNDLYKTASNRFKETNKDIIRSNQATEKWNRSMANIGASFEPVVADVKELGASLLEYLEEPAEDLADTLTNDVFPAIKSGVKWIKENWPAITGVIVGGTVAVVGYKASVLAAEAAEKGLTIAKLAGAAAQKALNVAMAANPIGLVVAAVAAAAAGFIAWGQATQKAAEDVTILTEEEQKFMKATAEASEALRDQNAAYDEAAGGIMSQMSHTISLADELGRLADSSGRVKEADQARAEFILGQLNEALGTEYNMVDGVIQQYGTLKDEIYNVISAKTANSLLEANNAAYIEAQQNEQAALAGVTLAHQDYLAQRDVVSAKQQEYDDLEAFIHEKEAQRLSESEARNVEAMRERLETLGLGLEREKGILADKETAYNDYVTAAGENQATIARYEEAQAAILQGNYEKATEILKNKGGAMFNYSDNVDTATREVIDTLYNEAVQMGIKAEEAKRNFENGMEGYTEETVKEAEQAYEDALSEWATAYDDAHEVGEDLGGGIKAGLNGSEGGLISRAKGIIGNIISAMKKAADSHSPSKKTKVLGKDIDAGLYGGMDEDADKAVKSARNLVEKSLLPIEASVKDVSVNGFDSLFNSSKFISTMQSSLKGRAIDNGGQWISALISGLTAAQGNTPIILQVDGKTFAQTSIDSINALTKQTGALSLKLV